MVDEHDIRAIAMTLPDTTEEAGSAHFRTAGKGIAWPYLEKIDPKKARVERRDIFAFRVASEEIKFALIANDPDTFFTTDHYNGYPAVLVRLPAIEIDDLHDLLSDAHAAATQLKRRSRRSKTG